MRFLFASVELSCCENPSSFFHFFNHSFLYITEQNKPTFWNTFPCNQNTFPSFLRLYLSEYHDFNFVLNMASQSVAQKKTNVLLENQDQASEPEELHSLHLKESSKRHAASDPKYPARKVQIVYEAPPEETDENNAEESSTHRSAPDGMHRGRNVQCQSEPKSKTNAVTYNECGYYNTYNIRILHIPI